jgi:hypothetical protein
MLSDFCCSSQRCPVRWTLCVAPFKAAGAKVEGCVRDGLDFPQGKDEHVMHFKSGRDPTLQLTKALDWKWGLCEHYRSPGRNGD